MSETTCIHFLLHWRTLKHRLTPLEGNYPCLALSVEGVIPAVTQMFNRELFEAEICTMKGSPLKLSLTVSANKVPRQVKGRTMNIGNDSTCRGYLVRQIGRGERLRDTPVSQIRKRKKFSQKKHIFSLTT